MKPILISFIVVLVSGALFAASTSPEAAWVGGLPVVTLERPAPEGADKPYFKRLQVLPGRGMNTFQIIAHLPGKGDIEVLSSPGLTDAANILNGGKEDSWGNKSFSLGGAILLPYANRIRGKLSTDGSLLETRLAGRSIRLPANWIGKKPDAERCAMHGLMLNSKLDEFSTHYTNTESDVTGLFHAGNFDGHWLSKADIHFEYVLRDDFVEIQVTTTNVGSEPLPVGVGWHPWFNIPSGKREQARLHIPAKMRTEVDNYDNVFPTGKLLPLKDTPYDFSAQGGAPLAALFLDDNFVDLAKTKEGNVVAEIIDPLSKYGLRIIGESKEMHAIQIYSPVERPIVVLEPQFNLADPGNPVWGKRDTGMVTLRPGQSVSYRVKLQLFVP